MRTPGEPGVMLRASKQAPRAPRGGQRRVRRASGSAKRRRGRQWGGRGDAAGHWLLTSVSSRSGLWRKIWSLATSGVGAQAALPRRRLPQPPDGERGGWLFRKPSRPRGGNSDDRGGKTMGALQLNNSGVRVNVRETCLVGMAARRVGSAADEKPAGVGAIKAAIAGWLRYPMCPHPGGVVPLAPQAGGGSKGSRDVRVRAATREIHARDHRHHRTCADACLAVCSSRATCRPCTHACGPCMECRRTSSAGSAAAGFPTACERAGGVCGARRGVAGGISREVARGSRAGRAAAGGAAAPSALLPGSSHDHPAGATQWPPG
eukprot:351244-Chlamydomonas_euryale.AAC.3